MALVEVSKDTFNDMVTQEGIVLVDAWAEWCGPCRMVSPIIDELAAEYEDRVTIGKVNVDENDDVVSEYGIRNIPTILLFKDGQMVDKQIDTAQKNALAEKIKKLL